MEKTEYYKLEMIELLPEFTEIRSSNNVRLLTFVMLFSFLVIIAVIIFMPWLQTVFGADRVIAYAPLERQQEIEAPVAGRVMKWMVREGSKVKKGLKQKWKGRKQL